MFFTVADPPGFRPPQGGDSLLRWVFFVRWYRVKYEKPDRTLEEQAALLLPRGLVADKLVTVLSQINYYRP
jgi:hypothetical protein